MPCPFALCRRKEYHAHIYRIANDCKQGHHHTAFMNHIQKKLNIKEISVPLSLLPSINHHMRRNHYAVYVFLSRILAKLLSTRLNIFRGNCRSITDVHGDGRHIQQEADYHRHHSYLTMGETESTGYQPFPDQTAIDDRILVLYNRHRSSPTSATMHGLAIDSTMRIIQ